MPLNISGLKQCPLRNVYNIKLAILTKLNYRWHLLQKKWNWNLDDKICVNEITTHQGRATIASEGYYRLS